MIASTPELCLLIFNVMGKFLTSLFLSWLQKMFVKNLNPGVVEEKKNHIHVQYHVGRTILQKTTSDCVCAYSLLPFSSDFGDFCSISPLPPPTSVISIELLLQQQHLSVQ